MNENSVSFFCHTTAITLERSGIAMMFILPLTPIPGIVIASNGILDHVAIKFIAKLIDVKVKKYDKKVKHIQKYIDELFIFIKKSNADNVITEDELRDYQKIVDEYE